MGFQDESGISDRPFVATTWALKGKTPIITSTGSWKNLSLSGIIVCSPAGNRSRLFLRIFPGSMNAKDIVRFLKELKRFLKGKKLLLFWDGLPAHRAKIVRAYVESQSWLRIERFPAYEPELNPIEYLWSSMKRKDLAHHPPSGMGCLRRTIHRSRRRLSNTRLLRGFLEASTLY
ncbi:MAG: transposase [Patescibacteria group bacterium]